MGERLLRMGNPILWLSMVSWGLQSKRLLRLRNRYNRSSLNQGVKLSVKQLPFLLQILSKQNKYFIGCELWIHVWLASISIEYNHVKLEYNSFNLRSIMHQDYHHRKDLVKKYWNSLLVLNYLKKRDTEFEMIF